GLAHADDHGLDHVVPGQDPRSHGLSERLDELEGRLLDDLARELVHTPVVDRLRQVVASGGGAGVELQLDVDLEPLLLDLLPVVHPVPGEEDHAREDDGVARVCPHRGVPAWASGAARTFSRTSWTRTMSTPASMPSAVVASV